MYFTYFDWIFVPKHWVVYASITSGYVSFSHCWML